MAGDRSDHIGAMFHGRIYGLERIHNREGDTVELERHVVLAGMIPASTFHRTSPIDAHRATGSMKPPAQPGAPDQRATE